MRIDPSQAIFANELAQHIGVKPSELHYLAYVHRLPFMCAGKDRWCIHSKDLGAWRAAVPNNIEEGDRA